MYSSKLVAVFASLTALALAAAVIFQVLEMKDYNLFETLKARFGVAGSETVQQTSPAAEKPAQAAAAEAPAAQ